MGRQQDSALFDDMFDALKVLPAWVGPVAAAVIFCVFRFILPLITAGSLLGQFFEAIMTMVAWVLALTCLVAWMSAEIHKLIHRRMFDRQTGLQSVRDLTWRQFEELVAEAYRRQGYQSQVVGTASDDGGVDVRLAGRGQIVLVQCKHWRAYKVGVRTLRELLGVVVAENATRGIVVTSGEFTAQSERFARGNPRIELVNGQGLSGLLQTVPTRGFPVIPLSPPAHDAYQPCPICGAAMVLRTARKGRNAGSQFWGCSSYPECHGIRPLLPGTSGAWAGSEP